MPTAERWDRVSWIHPCPVCQKPDWCRVSPDGAVVACMRVPEGAFTTRTLTSGEPCYLHRLDEPVRLSVRPARTASPVSLALNAARDLYAAVAEACAAQLSAAALDDLARRFGPNASAVVARWGIGFCPTGTWLPALLHRLDRCGLGIRAGVLTPRGETVQALAGRLVIPYHRGGQVCDLRGAGIQGRGYTGERNLRGGYQVRGVENLFFDHDALHALQPQGTIHLAGGAWKAVALTLAGLPTVGTRGEGELTDGHLAQLRAHGVAEVVLHVDAEDPAPGRALSEGRRLGLFKARRLAAAGFAVRVAEPPREPGMPKADPDAVLKAYGPALLRACAVSALPLAAWELAIGAAPVIEASPRLNTDAS